MGEGWDNMEVITQQSGSVGKARRIFFVVTRCPVFRRVGDGAGGHAASRAVTVSGTSVGPFVALAPTRGEALLTLHGDVVARSRACVRALRVACG